jgi:lactoylglutathione lyase
MNKAHISIRVSDPERSKEFYRKLGFELKKEIRLEKFSSTLIFMAISSDFEVELVHNWGNNDKPAMKDGYLHLGLDVDDLEGFLKSIKSQGVEPLCPVNITPGGDKLCFVMDPDGYQIELVQPSKK